MKTKALALIVLFICGFVFTNQSFSQDAPKTKTIKMTVGFHCAGGKAKIEKTLGEMDGVKSYTVNLETKEVEVVFDKDKTSENRLADAMLNLGYSVNGKAPKTAHKCEGGHTEGEHKEHQE